MSQEAFACGKVAACSATACHGCRTSPIPKLHHAHSHNPASLLGQTHRPHSNATTETGPPPTPPGKHQDKYKRSLLSHSDSRRASARLGGPGHQRPGVRVALRRPWLRRARVGGEDGRREHDDRAGAKHQPLEGLRPARLRPHPGMQWQPRLRTRPCDDFASPCPVQDCCASGRGFQWAFAAAHLRLPDKQPGHVAQTPEGHLRASLDAVHHACAPAPQLAPCTS